jgi:hypothetical protein
MSHSLNSASGLDLHEAAVGSGPRDRRTPGELCKRW